MSEERAPVAEEVPAEEVAAEVVEPEVPAWRKALEEAPVEELREHPRFKGVLGSELETRRLSWVESEDRRRAKEDADATAAAAMEELRGLARNDPDKLAERFLSDDEKRQQQQEIASLRSSEREQLARSTGQAFRALPEWSELTPADHQEFVEALAGKGDDEVLPIFTALASRKIAAVQARKQVAAWRESELPKQREAIRLEERTELLQNGDRPGIGRTRGNGTISDEPNWRTEPGKWEAWYSRQATGSRR